MFLIRFIHNFFVECYWSCVRSIWRYENRMQAMNELPWWGKWFQFMKMIFWKLYPIPGSLRLLLIRGFWKIRYMPGHIKRWLIAFYWAIRRVTSWKMFFVQIYWRLFHFLGSCKVLLIRVVWLLRRSTTGLVLLSLKLWNLIPFWKLRVWFLRIPIAMYWFIFNRSARILALLRQAKVQLIRSLFFIRGVIDYSRGYLIRAYWIAHNSPVGFVILKVYWFSAYQMKKIFSKMRRSYEPRA